MKIRLSTLDDMRLFWELRNEPEARKQFNNSKRLPWKKHVDWFNSSIVDEKKRFFTITTKSGQGIGYIRFDVQENGSLISICIDKSMRSCGIGTKALRLISRRKGIKKPILAEIKAGNIGSFRAFQRAGFKFKGGICPTVELVQPL